MDEKSLFVLAAAMLLAGILSALYGLLPAGVFALVGLAIWGLSKFEQSNGLVFFAGSLVTAILGIVMSTVGFLLAFVVGIVLLVVAWKTK